MPLKDTYNTVEWSILTELPVRVLAAAAQADESSSIGSVLEQATGLSQLSIGANEHADSELVQTIFAEFKDAGEGEAKTLELSDQWIDQLQPQTFERARQAAAILADRIDPGEALAYKYWLFEAADAVCAAAKTGGFLGIGGERVSEKEQAFLDGLAASLGLPDSPDQVN